MILRPRTLCQLASKPPKNVEDPDNPNETQKEGSLASNYDMIVPRHSNSQKVYQNASKNKKVFHLLIYTYVNSQCNFIQKDFSYKDSIVRMLKKFKNTNRK